MSEMQESDLERLLRGEGVLWGKGIEMPHEYIKRGMSIPSAPGMTREDYIVSGHLVIEMHVSMLRNGDQSGVIYLSEEIMEYLLARRHIFDECLKPSFEGASTSLAIDFHSGTISYTRPSFARD